MVARKLPRFTIKRAMLFVLLAAVVLGTYVEVRRRRERFLALVTRHASAEQAESYRRYLFTRMQPSLLADAQVSSPELAAFRRKLDYHRAMKVKYIDAVKRPWLPVAPDLPKPE